MARYAMRDRDISYNGAYNSNGTLMRGARVVSKNASNAVKAAAFKHNKNVARRKSNGGNGG